MTKPIDLNELIEQMDMQFEEYRTFVNKDNGVFVTVSSDKLRDVEDGEIVPPYDGYQDWEKDELRDCEAIIEGFNDKFISIPSNYDIRYTSGGAPFAITDEISEWIKDDFELYPDWLKRINDIY